MIKNHKLTLIFSSIVLLLPIVVGACLWGLLPDLMVSHFDINGVPDAFLHKAWIVFAFPFLFLALQWLCVFMEYYISRKKGTETNSKMLDLVLWIVPIISLVMYFIMYGYALGLDIKMGIVISVLLGLMFIVMGNYLPKCTQSYTMGIKLPWTLKNKENWQKTHRFSGILYVICGVAMLAVAFLASFWIILGIVLLAVIAPVLYSYIYYKKHPNEIEAIASEQTETKPEDK